MKTIQDFPRFDGQTAHILEQPATNCQVLMQSALATLKLLRLSTV